MGSGPSKWLNNNLGPLPPLKQGQVDIDKYRVTVYPNIGAGAFGQVCEGFDKGTRDAIAAKGIKVASGGQEYREMEKMAISEGEKMRAIDYIHIVKFLSYCKHEDTVWLFMEFCDLGDFDKYMKLNPTLPVQKRIRMLYEITCAVDYLHHHNPPIIHRDIKPGNALMKKVGTRNMAKLTDFGYAKLYDYSLSNPTFSTMVNKSSAGTPMYSAPEFFLKPNGLLEYTSSVDIFSLGLMNAVIFQYSPDNQSTIPNSVANRKQNKTSIFGRDMADAFKKGNLMPKIIDSKSTSDGLNKDLKHLISNMVSFESSNRPSIEHVRGILEPHYDIVSLNKLLHKTIMQIKQVELSHVPWSLKVIHDELWSCQEDGITVYDQELKKMRSMRGHGDDRRVLSVVLLPDDTLVVAGWRHLYRMSTSGDFIRTIAKVTYFDLSIYDGQLYATDLNSAAIHVYDCNTWKRLLIISTPCSDSRHSFNEFHHRICVHLTHISISCLDTNKFYFHDKNGKLEQSYGPNIDSRPKSALDDEDVSEDSNLRRPYISQMDDDGALLVANRLYDRLLMLTATGQWRRIHLSDRLDEPLDAVWWRGRLYVSTKGDNRLSMFE